MMFKNDDIVLMKTHPEYGIGKVFNSPFLYTGYYGVTFPGVNLLLFVNDGELLNANDFWGIMKFCSEILENSEEGEIMPKITNYNYNEETAVTTIEWSDGTKTTVRAEHPDTADPYTGFVTACAKRAFGNNNTINNLFDEWAIKKPKREMEEEIKINAELLEAKRILEKRKAKKEKWAIRKRAAEIAKEYEAKKLAHEKYGVPMGDNTENGVK